MDVASDDRPGAITVRAIRREDLRALRALGRRAFPPPLALLLATTVAAEGVAVEGPDGALAGALTLRAATVGGRRVGILDWAMVDPRHRGRGISTALGDGARDWFRRHGCDTVVTTGVDGYNASAWHAAHAHGLRYWPPAQQLREFGWRWPQLLIAIPHVGVSTFLLHRPPGGRGGPETGERANLGALVGVVLFLGLVLLPLSRARAALWASGAPADLLAPLAPTAVAWGAAITALYLGARMAGHWLAARALGLPLAFRPWESGLLLATLLAVAFSPFIPAYGGSVYVRRARFNYRRARAAMGQIMLAGVAPSLALCLAFTAWASATPGAPGEVATLGRGVGLAFAITDTLLFFPPFQALPAGHLWRWRRSVWLAATACFLAVLFALPRLL